MSHSKTTPKMRVRTQNLIARRDFLAGSAAGLGCALVFPQALQAAPEPSQSAQKIADHFSSVKTMMGEFVQFGPTGEQTGGRFFISRPGKLRFNYDKPSPLRVIADGRNVVIGNVKLKTWDLYPLSKTPLSLLLSDKIDLQRDMVRSVQEDKDLTTIVLGDKTIFGESTITLMFDPQTFDLRQWTITDPQAKDTTVMIFNVQNGATLDDQVFEIPYSDVHSMNR
jgi:outer membrane lipoprotein-sorting protein